MDSWLQDLRYGVRLLLKSPGFSAVAILVLALGIGANTAVFSLVDAVLLRPLPFPHPESLVNYGLEQSQEPLSLGQMGVADFVAIRERQHSFDHVAAVGNGGATLAFSNGGEPQRVRGALVSREFFDVLGVKPERGRTFTAEDDTQSAPPVMVVSHDFWQSQLASDPAVTTQTVTLSGRKVRIVGVMPPGFRFPGNQPIDVWPLRVFETARSRPPYFLMGIARLKPGVTAEQAAAELTAISVSLQQQYPSSPYTRARVVSMKEALVTESRRLLWVLLGAVTFVLLIAMVNIANLLLARGTAREREIGVRLAVGATPARIVRQLLTESVLLSGIGGAVGVLLSVWAVQAFLSFGPHDIPRSYETSVDVRVLLFTTALSILTGLFFGVMPAVQSAKLSLHARLQEGARSTPGAGQLTRNVLVVSQFALALILMVGAALMIRSFARLQQVSPGFDTSRLLTARVSLPGALYQKEPEIVAFWDRFLERVNALPGVESAAVTISLPPHLLMLSNPFTVEGQPYDHSRPLQLAEEMSVSPNYFHTLGLAMIAGRTFNNADRSSGQAVLIINRTMAQKFFPGQDPVGKRIQTGDPDPRSPWETIIGVVGDAKYSGLDSAPTPQLYVPYTARGWTSFSRTMYLVVHARGGDPLALSPDIRRELAALDRTIPLSNVTTMTALLGESVEQQRFRTMVLGAFAALALMLAGFGIYAVIAFFVGQRTREIGIRMALGATRGQIAEMVLRQAAVMCGIGLAIGVVGALALTREIRSLLFAVSPADPVSFIVTLCVLSGVALAAAYIPARRATHVDPMVALRYE